MELVWCRCLTTTLPVGFAGHCTAVDSILYVSLNPDASHPPNMKALLALLICSLALLLASCRSHLVPLLTFARFDPPIADSFQLAANTAVIYGRFVKYDKFSMGDQIGLKIRNLDSKEQYLIRLGGKDAVYGIAVRPGQYAFVGFVGLEFDHRVMGVRNFKNPPSFTVPANSLVYFADINGLTFSPMIYESWSITGATNNFAATTDEFRQRHPNLVSASIISAWDQLGPHPTNAAILNPIAPEAVR